MQRNWGAFTTAFVAGIGIGTAVGLILAPKSGEEMRADLSDAAKEAINQAGAASARATRRVRQMAENVAGQVSDAVDAGRREYDRTKHHIA